jgi:transcriptional regulator with PAS, ATPase and Fis domain
VEADSGGDLQLSGHGKFASFDNLVNVSIISWAFVLSRAFVLSEICKSWFCLRNVGDHSNSEWRLKCVIRFDSAQPRRITMASLDLIGSGKRFRALLDNVAMVARVDTAVLIQGETGTGKELIARAIHEASARRKNRFVALNCAAIPSTLLESELFGY